MIGGFPLGRPKNLQTKAYITRAAFELFMQKGYNKTTYKDIAEDSSNDRTLIQYYFPKKNLLIIDFLDKLLKLTENYILEKSLNSDNNYVNFYIIGQIHFSFLLKDEEMKILMLDIVSDRSITEEIIRLNENWVFSHMHAEQKSKKDLSDNIVMVMGGAYELVYRYLTESNNIHIPYLLEKIMINFMTGLGYEYSISAQLLSSHALCDMQLREANSYLSVAMLQ